MNKSDMMSEFISNSNGYLISSKAKEAGFSKQYISDYVFAHNLQRVASGIYITDDTWQDDMFITQSVNSAVILSHESALALHGLTEKEPSQIVVSVPRGYNATHLRKAGIAVHTLVRKNYEIGKCEMKTFWGNTVIAYDIDRTICDIIRNKDKTDIQVFAYAVKEYMRSNKKNLVKLSEYAGLFGIEDKIRTYTEVML